MNRVVKALMALISFVIGLTLCYIGWSIPLNPYWLNTVAFCLGSALYMGAGGFVFIKVMRRIIN